MSIKAFEFDSIEDLMKFIDKQESASSDKEERTSPALEKVCEIYMNADGDFLYGEDGIQFPKGIKSKAEFVIDMALGFLIPVTATCVTIAKHDRDIAHEFAEAFADRLHSNIDNICDSDEDDG